MRKGWVVLFLAVSMPAVADGWIDLLFGTRDEGTREEGGGASSPMPHDFGEPLGVFHYRMRLDYLVSQRSLSGRVRDEAGVKLDLYADDACSGTPFWSGMVDLDDPSVVLHDLDRWMLDAEGTAVATSEIRAVRPVFAKEEIRSAFLAIDDGGLVPVGGRCQPQRLSQVPSPAHGLTRWGYALAPWGQPEVTELIAVAGEAPQLIDLGSTEEVLCMLSGQTIFQSDPTGGPDRSTLQSALCHVSPSADGRWRLSGSSLSFLGDPDPDVQVRCYATCLSLAPMEELVH
mgnify:CR=1 FL=1